VAMTTSPRCRNRPPTRSRAPINADGRRFGYLVNDQG